MFSKIILIFMNACICCALKTTLFERIPSKDGYMCTGDGALSTHTDVNLSRCAIECNENSDCQRFCFDSSSGFCTKCTSVMDQDTGFLGSVCYARQMAYLGCFQDSGTNRMLSLGFYQSDAMTNEVCVQYCVDFMGFLYAGTQQPGLCFCGNHYDEEMLLLDSDCQHVCLGDSGQMCGGGYRNSIHYRP